jgi:tetratricopeptide (TPR) repeat protein
MALLHLYRILTAFLVASNGATPYELYSIGSQLEMAGKTAEAIEYYRRAVELDPEAVELYTALINAYYQLRDYDQGIAWAGRALERIPGEPKLYLSIALGYIGKGEFKKSIEYYRRCLAYEKDPIQREDLYSAITTIYEVLGDLKSARRTLTDIPDDEKTQGIYAQLGTLSGKMNDHQSAVDYYRKSYALDTANATATLGLATGFDYLGVKDSSIYYYERCLSIDSFYTIRKRLVDLYSDTDQYDKLVTTARQILDADYYESGVRRSLGFALYKTGDSTAALNEFLIASRLNPADTYSRFYVGKIYLENGRYNDAQEEIEQALRINPDFLELWIYLGFVLIDKRDYEKAQAVFAEAGHRGANPSEVYYLLGFCSELEGRPVDAYHDYRKALGLDPKNLSVLQALANFCDRQNRQQEAFVLFQRIMALDTLNSTALNYVGYTYAERAESLDYALTLIDRALELEPDNGYIIDSRGWVFYQQGLYDEARVELERANRIIEDRVILEHLGDAYQKLGDFDRARELYEKALTLDPKNKALRKKLGRLPPVKP